MAVTPFLKLQKPPFDTIPWDEAVNGNMDTIDAFISRYMAVPNYVGAWANSTNYVSGQNVLDISNATIYLCQVTHVSSATPTTFAQDRTTYPTYWAATTNVVSGSIALTIAEVTPLSSKAGDLWWNSAEGQLYILYNDGNSLQWVVANNQSGNIGDAPRDGNIYGRQMGAWVGSVNSQDVGRNKLHNGLFTVAQRGVGPFSTNGSYVGDRWQIAMSLDTANFVINTADDASRTAVGDEVMQYLMGNSFTGNAGAASFTEMYQRIENVRRLAGKTVIVSFWANASVSKIGVSLDQNMGTGGSPSAAVNGNGVAITFSSGSLTRYSATFALPSLTGKTLGTNNDHNTQLNFWFSSGTTQAARAGSIGVQTGAVNLWGVQLEIAAPGQTQPSPLEKKDPRMELSDCQRFFCANSSPLQVAFNSWGVSGFQMLPVYFPVPMRASPTVVIGAGSANTNISSVPPSSINPMWFFAQAIASNAGAAVITLAGYNASADL